MPNHPSPSAEQEVVFSGAECRTMEDVRREIDRIDRELVKLLAERQTYIEAAARIKHNRDEVHDEERIADVIEKVLSAAAECGLSAEIAEPVWRLLIERSIAHEFNRFDDRGDD